MTIATLRASACDRLADSAEPVGRHPVVKTRSTQEIQMGFGKGVLLWLIGIPLPIIILLALFMHH